jgi:hypothetical protein
MNKITKQAHHRVHHDLLHLVHRNLVHHHDHPGLLHLVHQNRHDHLTHLDSKGIEVDKGPQAC